MAAGLHWLALVVWLPATPNGLGDGSDTRTAWAIEICGVRSPWPVRSSCNCCTAPGAGASRLGRAALMGQLNGGHFLAVVHGAAA